MSSHDNASNYVYECEETGLRYYGEVERLWGTLTGGYRDQFYRANEDAAEEIVQHGEIAARLILKDLEVSIDEKRLGGYLNIPLVRRVLSEIGGETARQALDLLSVIEDEDEAEDFEQGAAEPVSDYVKRLTAILTGGDPDAAIAAANALGKTGPDALDALVAAIGTCDEWTSEAAIEAVVALGGDPRAVVPTLEASLPAQSWPWTISEGIVALGAAFNTGLAVAEDQKARLRAIGKMGSQAFEPLLAATENRKAEVRSLALRALMNAAVEENPEGEGRRERTIARAIACLKDRSGAVRLSAVQVLGCLDVPGRTDLLLPLLSDIGNDDQGCHVCEAAADALPDGEGTAEYLRQALEGRPLSDGSRLRASSVLFALTSRDAGRKARWLDIVAPYVLQEAEGNDQPRKAIRVLSDPQIMEVLEKVDPDKRRAAEKLVRKDLERQEAQKIIWWRKEQPSPPRPTEQVRAAILVRFERLAEEVLAWLSWSDADLLALPLDLQQAWVDGPNAWEAALRSTDLWLPNLEHDPQKRPQQLHRAAPFQSAEHAYMKSHLSAEDYAWYMAAERVGAMRDEAQAAWQKGPLAWAAFLTPPRPKAAS